MSAKGFELLIAHGAPWDDPEDFRCAYVVEQNNAAMERMQGVPVSQVEKLQAAGVTLMRPDLGLAPLVIDRQHPAADHRVADRPARRVGIRHAELVVPVDRPRELLRLPQPARRLAHLLEPDHVELERLRLGDGDLHAPADIAGVPPEVEREDAECAWHAPGRRSGPAGWVQWEAFAGTQNTANTAWPLRKLPVNPKQREDEPREGGR